VKAGKTVELRERDRVIGRIIPENGDKPTVEWPDFAARAKEILGGRVLPGSDLLIAQRRRARY